MPAPVRSELRQRWFDELLKQMADREIVFADPDNGIVDNNDDRRRRATFGKQMPLSEIANLTAGRTSVIYHHNTRFSGGHEREVSVLREQLGSQTLAVRANAYSCRTFFIVSPSESVRRRAAAFCQRWSAHRVSLNH